MTELVEYTHNGPAAVITMNRPEKRNALSRQMVADLVTAFHRAETDPSARCVILTGRGSAFCAGMDLDELRSVLGDSNEPEMVWEDARKLSALYDQIYRTSKPTIAAVNGPAVAGGCGLVTVCDLAVSVGDAKFGYPEVRRGLVAAMVMPHLLRHVNERTARWLLLTGELIDGVDALRLGLVNVVTSLEGLIDTCLGWAVSFAEGGPQALATTKSLLSQMSRHAMGVEELAAASAEPRLTDECHHGLAAFFDKRPAPWAGTNQ